MSNIQGNNKKSYYWVYKCISPANKNLPNTLAAIINPVASNKSHTA